MRYRSLLLLAALVLTACEAVATPKLPTSGLPNYFQEYYEAHGGLYTLGAPINVGGAENGAQVQCYQNGVLEYHPELEEGRQVYLSALGVVYGEQYDPVDAATIPAGALYFPETGHSVQGRFRAFFDTYGGVSFFGFPISEALVEDSDVLIQHFERATLRYDRTLPTELNVQMVAWGERHYLEEEGGCTNLESVTVEIIPTPVAPSEEDLGTDPVAQFVTRYSGEAFFGQPLDASSLVPESVRVFENAVLEADPDAPDGVRIRPLGLEARGAIDPSAERLDIPEAIYFDETGHNVAYGFKTFFEQHGGSAVFGLPITEVLVEDGRLVQYFENVRVEWHSGAQLGQGARLTHLGQQYLATVKYPTPTTPMPPPQISAESWQYHPVANRDDEQILFVWVVDENQSPVVEAEVRVDIHTPYGVESYTLEPTDNSGITQLIIRINAFQPGDQVVYDVYVRSGSLNHEFTEQFQISQAAVP